jgi:hypothetical protein
MKTLSYGQHYSLLCLSVNNEEEQTRLKMIVTGKRSSLFCRSVIYKEIHSYKTFFF